MQRVTQRQRDGCGGSCGFICGTDTGWVLQILLALQVFSSVSTSSCILHTEYLVMLELVKYQAYVNLKGPSPFSHLSMN